MCKKGIKIFSFDNQSFKERVACVMLYSLIYHSIFYDSIMAIKFIVLLKKFKKLTFNRFGISAGFRDVHKIDNNAIILQNQTR